MHPDKQRIKIAQICGVDGDYLNDLNAMHEAEKRLNYWHRNDYSMKLKSMILTKILGEDSNNLNDISRAVMRLPFVTAAQKAEAFLKTFGEWCAIDKETQQQEAAE